MCTATKIVLVTNGSRGQEKDMAISIAKKVRDVVLTYHTNEAEAQQTVQSMGHLGRKQSTSIGYG